MKNMVLITSLGLAIVAGGAVASSDRMEGKHHRLHHSFEELDANGDGKLMKEELETHMQARFDGADADGDGMLSQDELLARMTERMAQRAEKYVAHMIDRHDADNDGALSTVELRSRQKGDMFARMDADQDGAVTREEFEAGRDHHRSRKHGGYGQKHDNREQAD